MNKFEKLGIDEDFNPFYVENNIKEPTPVQLKTIPMIMGGESLLCVAQTGTGKTLSFALPISELIKQIEDENGLTQKAGAPYAVIVAPTKELAGQIDQVFKDISHHVKLRCRSLIGKKNIKSQEFEILISTPSKLGRSLKNKEIHFSQLKYLVFDEADTLFEMGFKKDIESILRHVEYEDTDIHFFTATMPLEVEEYINEKFKKKELKKVILGDSHSVQKRVETFNVFVKAEEKHQMLKMFLQKTAQGRGIVFCNQKNQVEELSKFIAEKLPELKIDTLHGNLSEKERLAAHKNFATKKSQVLIATDVAARGIDIKDLAWVLNFYLPKTPIYYLHRSGRTARANAHGQVFNFVTPHDAKIVADINNSIRNQSHMSIDPIAKTFGEQKRKKATKVNAGKSPKKSKKTKRVKITKRTKRD